MRLVRRFLLCLVVGVTAFGVAGWLLRPEPTWETPLRQSGAFSFLVPQGRLDDANRLLWVCTNGWRIDENEPPQILVAYDVAGGSEARRIELQPIKRQCKIE